MASAVISVDVLHGLLAKFFGKIGKECGSRSLVKGLKSGSLSTGPLGLDEFREQEVFEGQAFVENGTRGEGRAKGRHVLLGHHGNSVSSDACARVDGLHHDVGM